MGKESITIEISAETLKTNKIWLNNGKIKDSNIGLI